MVLKGYVMGLKYGRLHDKQIAHHSFIGLKSKFLDCKKFRFLAHEAIQFHYIADAIHPSR
jgi:hypothetical protein